MSTLATFKTTLAALFGHAANTSNPDAMDAARRAFRYDVVGTLADDGGAGNAVTEAYFWRAKSDCHVVDVKLLSPTAETANDTNYATITLQKADGAGGASSTVASQTTKTVSGGGGGNIVVGVPWNLPIASSAAAALTAGQVLAVASAKAASGLDMAACNVIVTIEED